MQQQSFPAHDADGQLSLGEFAPDFSLPNVIDGKIYSLSEIKGVANAAVVIFSCNHCPWVIKYEDRMIELSHELKSSDVYFFVISSNDVVKYPQDSTLAMKERALQKQYPFPYLFDETQEVAHAFGAQVTPHIFVLDRELKLCYRGAFDDNPDNDAKPTKAYLRDAVQAILNNDTASIVPQSTRAMGCSVKWK